MHRHNAWAVLRMWKAPGLVLGATGFTLWLAGGCPTPRPPVDGSAPPFNNTTDPTNRGAHYIGSTACSACHPDIAALTRVHGHTFALNRVQGEPPVYPTQATRAGVPNPPDAKTWNDVSYVISGYTHGAYFVDSSGYVMTNGDIGADSQWNLTFPPNGTVAGFAPYLPNQTTPLPYVYDCFRCHTTAPQPQDPNDPRSQDGRPGIQGTWAEAGVQCEACHGPGSNHIPTPAAREMFVDSTPATCARCHTFGDDPNVIVAADGYVNPYTQYAELRASGGHSSFNCTVCHDPHVSTAYNAGVRNACTTCHAGMNLAFHEGIVFQRGDYREPLACPSCHMPFTGRSNSNAGPAELDNSGGRMGDVRGHVFRISTTNYVYTQMFSADGTSVLKDPLGLAAVTTDFVCLRCHNGTGNAFVIAQRGAPVIANQMHQHAASQP